MNLLRFSLIGMILGVLASCCTLGLTNKLYPEYVGVDPRTKSIVDEWLYLAKQRGLKFNNTVTIGFKHINSGNIIGLTNYGPNFRKIDLDIDFWIMTTNRSRTALLFHELVHAYCGRDHDFGNGEGYSESKKDLTRKHGYFEDHCALSIMHPIIVEDACFMAHYQEYISEMFNRCKEW